MANIVLSPYFSKNTKMVSNFCRICYLEENEIWVTAINVKFLKKYDPVSYHVFKNNYVIVPDTEKLFSNAEDNIKSSNPNFEISTEYSPKQEVEIVSEKNYKNSRLQPKNEIGETNIKDNNEYNTTNEIMEEKTRKDSVDLNRNTMFKLNDEFELNSEKYNNFDGNSKWIPPISPHNLIEERYYNDPWALLVVTIFLNRTSCVLALPCMEHFFDDFKGPYDVLKTKAECLEPYFTKIGLIKTRANQVWRMSHDFVHKNWQSVGELYGVGKYAEDAYRMFHLGDFSVEPTDRYLKIYKAWYRMMKRNKEEGMEEWNSQVYLEDFYITPEVEDRSEDNGELS